ncbi:sigma-54-dependent transcriptional regulator [Desulfonema magnum]|uniref:Sigma-54 interaction domain-containing protein n=1 Tax=Desulfonema magnum TaxID=45655 RepID=A0A975BJV9_9BACT|nr:sigma-54 dependent transcriptional regulator [Desulfonema magnum]QTA86612.1 Sigma-54 interaction domain-containing protein [Desulfonema magnum]
MRSAFIVSAEPEVFRIIKTSLGSKYRINKSSGKEDALEILRKKRYDIIFIDLKILNSGGDCKKALNIFWDLYPSVEIVVMSSQNTIREAVRAVKAGASDYLTYPIDPAEVRLVVENIKESFILQSELDYLRDKFWKSDFQEIVRTKNNAMKKVFDKIRSAAPTKTTVLLTGETGTGKGVLAKLIHWHSNRGNAQFIGIHCGAIPETLIESDLFGHEKGAFTGAVRKKPGKFEIARGGTIFLDEIGTISPSVQIKLLQVLQDGTLCLVGGDETIETDVRIIAATNADLKKMSDDGMFRKDLYYRLNVFPIEIPPLRERTEDISFLADIFLKRLNKSYTKEIHSVHSRVFQAFEKYSWPGNIREMENLMERAYILETSSVLTPESFPTELFEAEPSAAFFPVDSAIPLAEARRKAVEDFERQYLKDVLSRNKGKINKSAEDSGISTRQLNKLMQKYSLRKEEFKT